LRRLHKKSKLIIFLIIFPINKVFVKKQPPGPIRILFAPLDWGLGHATRCIPLIRFFLESGCSVWIAAEGKTERLLAQEFPDLSFLPLRGYRIRYAGSKAGLAFAIMGQIPGILQTIRYEKQWLREMIDLFAFDAVISDNRFGLHHPSVPSIYITHQLSIQAPGGAILESCLRRIHYYYINQFQACWIPDAQTTPNLSGKLAHPAKLPSVPVHYLGPLSRFVQNPSPSHSAFPNDTFPPDNELLVLLSGPEPQRTLFEERLLHELATFDGKAVLVRGLPGEALQLPEFNQVRIFNHLPAAELNEVICRSRWVIGRTGYTTVMDLVRLQKKSILVPTPGQTEQEYLATYLRAEGLSCTLPQASFSLKNALDGARAFHYRFPDQGFTEAYKKVAGEFLESLKVYV
jgi:hypothetical protein